MESHLLYQEASQTWRHFASWREKIFAGYLTVLAGLGIALANEPVPRLRVALYAATILVSVVFWLLDFRNSQILNACQAAAAALEDPQGTYCALRGLRKNGKWYGLTLGLAIDVLVSGVGAVAVIAIGIRVGDVPPENLLGPLLAGFAVMLIEVLLFQYVRRVEWNTEHPKPKPKEPPKERGT